MLFLLCLLAVVVVVAAADCFNNALPSSLFVTSQNAAPSTRASFMRGVYLIRASELGSAAIPGGASSAITGIGWTYSVAPSGGTAPLKIYLQNTVDTSNLKNAAFSTAITDMTLVHNSSTALPGGPGAFNIPFVGGAAFTYSGAGLYVAFDWGPYTGTTSSVLVSGNNAVPGGMKAASGGSAPATLSASNNRPATRLASTFSDVAVVNLFSIGSVPFGAGGPVTLRALVTNRGSEVTNLPVTLSIGGAQTFSDTKTISLGCAATATVSFTWLPTSTRGSVTASSSVPNDDDSANNAVSKPLDVTLNLYSYKYPGTASTGNTLLIPSAIVGQFATVLASKIVAVTLEFVTTGAPFRVLILSANPNGTPGSNIFSSTVQTTSVGSFTFTLPTPVTIPAGRFFVGVEQTSFTSVRLATDTESPLRPDTFFGNTPLTPAWADVSPLSPLIGKPNIGVVLDPCFVVPPTFSSCPTDVVRRLNDPNLCGAFVSFRVAASDNCGGAVSLSYVLSGATNSAGAGSGSLSAFNIGLSNVVVTAIDALGSSSTCAFAVEVIDASLSLSCPSNRTLCAGSTLTYDVFASGACPGVTKRILKGLPSGSTVPIGATETTYFATDSTGHQTQCSFFTFGNVAEQPCSDDNPSTTGDRCFETTVASGVVNSCIGSCIATPVSIDDCPIADNFAFQFASDAKLCARISQVCDENRCKGGEPIGTIAIGKSTLVGPLSSSIDLGFVSQFVGKYVASRTSDGVVVGIALDPTNTGFKVEFDATRCFARFTARNGDVRVLGGSASPFPFAV